MANLSQSSGIATRDYRLSYRTSFLIILVVVVRKLTYVYGEAGFRAAAALLGVFLLLFASEPLLSRRVAWYHPVYFLLQAATVQTLGLLRPYEDTWGILYIALGFQLVRVHSTRVAAAWGSAFAASLLLTMMFAFGWVSGLGRALWFIAAGILVVSYDLLYSQTEAARQESQVLVAELQRAHQKLRDYAAHAEDLAAAQERNRLAHELHDAVGQMIFGITLTAEAARLLIDKDPARVPEQLDRLQELTGQALSRMRALISQWRPG